MKRDTTISKHESRDATIYYLQCLVFNQTMGMQRSRKSVAHTEETINSNCL